MEKSKIVQKIEAFAPLGTQEKWDCSGFAVKTKLEHIQKIMLCLTVTEDIVRQAREQNCDMIISHHPLFCVPLEWKGIDIYCVHTNLDKVLGGTTDTLIEALGLEACEVQEFVRYVEVEISLEELIIKLKEISPSLRYVNNHGVKMFRKLAFCAGSGSEFIQEAFEHGADAFVTGDLKFHTALESPIAVFDIGHFESEILVLPVFERVIEAGVKFVYADEKSPFKNLDNQN